MTSIPITRKSIKHLYLRIDKDGELCISAPKNMPNSEIMAFIEEKSHWIAQKKHERALSKLHFNSKDDLMLFGKTYPIIRKQCLHDRLIVEDNICYVTKKPNSKASEQLIITEYYRAQLMPILKYWTSHYESIIGVNPNEVRTKNMKTKWGTCNIYAKRLWFNVQLARFSEKHIIYVVVHEMVHLLEPSHNERFYRLVEQAMPDWEVYHQSLKHNKTL